MGKQDWFRSTTWTPEVQTQFFTRLKRSKSNYHRAQYIRIQAHTLQYDASPPHYEDALELLDYLINKNPEPSELAMAYLQRAQCLENTGHIDDATQAFLSSLSAEKAYPNVKTNAPIEFAMFVLHHNLKQHYDTTLSSLEGIEVQNLFPISQYQFNLAHAILLAEKGKADIARLYAQKALAAAQQTYSGFRFHPTLGLVEKIDSQLHSRLQEIAKG
jgi:tetratricopeptide (TPR) repeat protein